MRVRAGWDRHRGGCGGVWEHLGSGWWVRHCGHPTALYPYFIQLPDGSEMYADNGRGFPSLEVAQVAVEELTRPIVLAAFPAVVSCPDCGANLNGKHRERDPATGDEVCFACSIRRRKGIPPLRGPRSPQLCLWGDE